MSVIAISTLLVAQLLGTALPVPHRAERELYLMGTRFHGWVADTAPARAEAALEAAVAELERWERLLSTWDPSTPMSALNRAAVGNPLTADPEILALLDEVLAWSARTGRAFDPTVGSLVDAWDLRGEGRRPTEGERTVALARTGPGAFRVDVLAGTGTRLSHGAWIDTGAFGKGAGLRAAADILRSWGVEQAILDLGGQLLVLGREGQPMEIAVAHPVHRTDTAGLLRLGTGSAATSGNSERGVTVGGHRLGHLLDPRTGLPAPDWGSVTVVSDDPLVADVLSTALYVMGPDAGLAWAETRDDVGALFLVRTAGGEIRTLHNQAMVRWLAQPPAPAGTTMTSAPDRRLP